MQKFTKERKHFSHLAFNQASGRPQVLVGRLGFASQGGHLYKPRPDHKVAEGYSHLWPDQLAEKSR